MAILFMDSFDHYTDVYQKYVSSAEAVIEVSANARYGPGCLIPGTYKRGCLRSRSLTPSSTFIVGFAYKSNAWGADSAIMSLREGTTTHINLRLLNGTRQWQVDRPGTVLGTSTVQFATQTWQYIEIKATIHDTAGSFELRQNGITILSGTNVDTRNGGTGLLDEIYIWDTGGADNRENNGAYLDDLYVCNTAGSVGNDFLGDTRIEYLAPTGAGTRTGFTPSAGSNWSNVDEVPASDTDYNSANTPGAMDLFQMANLSGNGLVRGVQTISRAKKDDAGFRKFKPAFFKASGLGSTDRWYTGTQVPVSDSYAFLPMQLLATSPDTGAAWTVDEINAIQYGYAVGDAGMFTIDARLV
jgi:hypothetical protein